MIDFQVNYECDESVAAELNGTMTTAMPNNATASPIEECLREKSILFLLLVVGTLWVGVSLFNFTKT